MPQHHAPTAAARAGNPSTQDSLRLSVNWLRLARIVWLVVMTVNATIFAVSLPLLYNRLQAPCLIAGCSIDYQLTPNGVRAMEALGVRVAEYAVYVTVLVALAALAQLLIACVIMWRESDNVAALVIAFSLVLSFRPLLIDVLQVAYPVSALPLGIVGWLGYNLSILVFYLFPTGRFVPRWTCWLFVAVFVLSVPLNFPNIPGNPFGWFPLLCVANVVLIVVVPILAQIYRYLRVSTHTQRQQTKWLVFGYIATTVSFSGLALWGQLVPSLNAVGQLAPSSPMTPTAGMYQLARVATGILVSLVVPVSVGVALLRYRLWDIDVLVNRTLVYGTLSAIAALLYSGAVVLLQAISRPLIGSEGQFVTVVSTLLIGALFQPLRHRIQALIDRRFYRRKYDAAKTLTAFSGRLRDEVELHALTNDLLMVVDETLQPAHVSLWLPDRKREAQT